MKKTSSLIGELLFLIMVGIFSACVLMWLGFNIGMRINADRQIRQITYETTGHLRDGVSSRLSECSMLLDFTAMSALPLMSEDTVDTRQLRDLYAGIKNLHDDVSLVFGASSGKFNEPGEFMVFSDGWYPTDPTYDNTTRSWHADAIAGRGRTVFTDPYIDMITKELVVSIVKGINKDGLTIGMTGIDLSMNSLNNMLNKAAIVDNLKSYIIHPSGVYITNSDLSKIEAKTDFFTDNNLEMYRNQIFSMDSFYDGSGKTIVCSMTIPLTGWKIVSFLPRNEIYKAGNRTSMISVAMVGGGIIVFVFVFLPIVRKKVRPIKEMAKELKDISEGEGDLTQVVKVASNNEVGELGYYINKTIEKIRMLVVNIREEAHVLTDIGSDLSSNMNETAAAINEITANIQSIKGRIINQSASVSETHATMDQVATNINKLNDQVEAQSSHVSQASAAIEEMVANIQSVTDTLIKNSANVKNLKEASEVGRHGLQDVASDIQEIARESEGLLEINAVMENIASQTNLLSMNAAIEAAHAGEAGKGFAVVADEIRKLAESSSEQSKTIGQVLHKIAESIGNITRSTDNVLSKFEAIEANIKIVSEQEELIRNAMEEQGEGSKQLLDGVTNVNDITRQVKSGSNEMLEGAIEVIQESTNLEKVTQEITSGINEMAAGADEINVAVHHVNEISGKNRDAIDLLIKEVSRFKVE
ncbi:MAG: methyl-accepting chemotaxis protein [Treponema sp.]|nr:methyl-accepting chemotaxis protein [Treponema sp.]